MRGKGDVIQQAQTSAKAGYSVYIQVQQESVRPRWPYDMRPSVRAEKYGCRGVTSRHLANYNDTHVLFGTH